MPREKMGAAAGTAPIGKVDSSPTITAAAKRAAVVQATFAEQECLRMSASTVAKAQRPFMPRSKADLQADPAFRIMSVGRLKGAANVPPAIARPVMDGIAAEGGIDAKDLETALAQHADGATVDVHTVTSDSGALPRLSFHAGDAEVGYLSKGGTPKYLNSDGWIQPR